MRLKRKQNDFRLAEVLDESFFGPGRHCIYRISKRGLTTAEAAERLAKAAGVAPEEVASASSQQGDGVSTQYFSAEGGSRVDLREEGLSIRTVGSAQRAIGPGDHRANSFEVIVRDLRGDDMRRLRHNLAQVKQWGLPAYFGDPRFGCLRHGQGFVVRELLRGRLEETLRALLCAPSPYGSKVVETYKEGIARRWGNWAELASFTNGRRGASAFAHLRDHPGDFEGALTVGVATRERTIHLYAWQSHLWNQAVSLWVRDRVPEEGLVWLPSDDGPLPAFREPPSESGAELGAHGLPLLGPGVELTPEARRRYEAVLRAEGVRMEDFLALDLSGFRPKSEPRPLLMHPEYLRAAPAERDDLYRERQKMRVRFTLPRGQYATLVLKRLLAAVETDAHPLWLWVSRHRLDYPDAHGRMPAPAPAPARAPAPRAPRQPRAYGDRPRFEKKPRWDSRRGGGER